MTAEQKKEIDDMSQDAMCRLWRFAASGHPLLINGDTGEYFQKVLSEKGGMTSEISKRLGW